MSRGFTALVVAAALLGMLAGGWGPSFAAGQAAGVFRSPLGGEPPTIDPYFATDFSSGDLTLLMYNSLVGFDGGCAGKTTSTAAAPTS